jgi:acyl dehydratase
MEKRLDANIGVSQPRGKVVRSQGRTIGEGEFAVLTDVAWTVGERHVNSEFATTRGERGRELAGPLVIALIDSLVAEGPLYRQLRDKHGVEIVRVVGVDATFFGSVRPGDTLWAESEILNARDDEVADGALELLDRGINQRDEIIVEQMRSLLVVRIHPKPRAV